MPPGCCPTAPRSPGPKELREALLARPEQFVQTFVEKLLAYALGRSTEWYDMPAVRRVVRQSAADDYRFSAVVTAIVQSVPFTTRDAGEGESPELSARTESGSASLEHRFVAQRRLTGKETRWCC